jgi:predicted nucleic acid-binding protein
VIAYLDSSFVVPIYVSEARSAEASTLLTLLGHEAAVSALTDVEVAAALQKHLSPTKQDGYLLYRQDRESALYGILEIDGEVFEEARRIAEIYAAKHFLRSLDILQLAIARRHGLAQIASFDDRLRHAAAVLGLGVLPARS